MQSPPQMYWGGLRTVVEVGVLGEEEVRGERWKMERGRFGERVWLRMLY